MDKYEYQVCADQIKELAEQGRFAEAMDIADTIDWKRVKSFSMLCTVSEIYKINKDYEESRKILLLAYDRYPDRPSVVYSLCELDIKLNEIEEAKEFYREFYQLRPSDTNRYALLYRLYEAMDYSLEEKISLLEEYKKAEYTEKWAYELAMLYHKTGQERKCVETCNEMILWFGDGDYVRKAMELKMKHENLTEEQQRKYEGEETSYGSDSYAQTYSQQQGYTGPQEYIQSGYVQQQGYVQSQEYAQPQQYAQSQEYVQPGYSQGYDQSVYGQQDMASQYGQYPYGYAQSGQQMQGYDQPGYSQGYDGYSGIQVQPINTGKYSTMNLQEELARNMQEVYGRGNNVPAGYYGDTGSLYEPSTGEYSQMLDQSGEMVEDLGYGPDMQYADGNYAENEPADAVVEMPMPTMSESNISVPNVVSSTPKHVEKIESELEELTLPGIEMPEEKPSEDSVQKHEEEPVMVQEPAVEEKTYEIKEEPSAGQKFDKVLSQEYDGQISMSIPDADMEVKQITGQIDISDFLKEWEEKKKNAQQHLREETRRKQIEQTNDIMSQLVGVIPGIEISAMQEKEAVVEEPSRKEEIVRSDEQGSLTKTTLKAPSYGREPVVKLTETGTVINGGPVKSPITGAIPDILPSINNVEKEDTSISEEPAAAVEIEETVPEEQIQKKEISKQDKPIVIPDYILNQDNDSAQEEEVPTDVEETEVIESEEIPEEASYETSDMEELVDDAVEESSDDSKIISDNSVPELIPGLIPGLIPDYVGFSTAPKEKVKEELPAILQVPSEESIEKQKSEEYSTDETELQSEIEPDESEPEVEESEEVESEELTPEEAETEAETESVEEVIPEEEPEEIQEVDENPREFPFDITSELEPVEELIDVEQSEEIDDLLKTGAIPLFDIEKESYESGVEEVEEEKKPSLPSYMQMGERREARRDLDPEESRIFGRFEGIESLKAQIVDVIDDMSMEPYTGNVIVMGSEYYGRKSLAIDIVKAIQAFDSSFSGKVAKISGEALNKKDIPMTLHKLKNGALIVENAGGLTPITVNTMIEILTGNADPILVVLEDSKDAMEPLITGCDEMKSVFNARIEMENFSDADLVAYAKGYAREQEYSIDDETGVLELYTRIHEMQSSIDDVVTVDDIKEIVDNAIRHVDRKNVSHFMDVLVGKRYDDDDFIVLRAKDFQY